MTAKKKKSKKKALTYDIPMDLTIQILQKLPGKSLMRFKCVSKSWYSIIHSMSLSLSQPRLVFILDEDQVLSLSSSSMLLSTKNTLTMPKLKSQVHYMCDSVRGFVCCRLVGDRFVVCNLTTGQVINLGERNSEYDYCYMYLGYDPNRDQYKVLRLRSSRHLFLRVEQSVRTLGSSGGEQSSHSWRPIKTKISYSNCYEGGVCIDGVVYFKCHKIQNHNRIVVSSFDVGSEQLHDIDTPLGLDLLVDLTIYLGKLAMYRPSRNGFILWVPDDAKNWSKTTYDYFPSLGDSTLSSLNFAGITAAGEIIYFPMKFYEPYEVICYDVEKKKMERRVRVERRCLYAINGASRSMLCSYVDNLIYL